MTTKAEKKAGKQEQLEIRLSLFKKDVAIDEDGKPLTHESGHPQELHTQHVSFEITDQTLCKAINVLLGDAITKEHIEDVAKDDKGEPVLDAHKFVLDGKKPEKKAPAA